MTELAYIVKKREEVDEIIYITDRLCWCHNTNKRLRTYVLSRVNSARRMIQWTLNTEDISLFHIDGKSNLADLLSKLMELEVRSVSIGSDWHEGLSWLKIDTIDMPITKYDQLTTYKATEYEVQKECFDEPFQLSANFSSHKVDLRVRLDTQ